MGRASNLAEQIEPQQRFVLAPTQPNVTTPSMPRNHVAPALDPLDEIFHRKTIRQHVIEFGQIMAIIGGLIAIYLGWTGKSLADVGAVALASIVVTALCSFLPRVMLPVYRAWMKLGWFLEITTTWMILGIMWAAMFVPFGLGLRLIGKRVMDMSYRTGTASYWLDIPKNKTDFLRLEKQY